MGRICCRSGRGRRRRHAHCRADDHERISTLHVRRRERPEQFVASLADYYAQTGSWDGVQDLVGNGGMTSGRGMGRGGLGGAGGRFIVADTQGNIVAGSTGVPGGQVTQDQLTRGVPITVKGKRVGTLLPTGGGFGQGEVMGQAEQKVIDRVNRAVIFAGLIAGVVALLLGFMVLAGITAPLDKLTTAAGMRWRLATFRSASKSTAATRSPGSAQRSTRWRRIYSKASRCEKK